MGPIIVDWVGLFVAILYTWQQVLVCWYLKEKEKRTSFQTLSTIDGMAVFTDKLRLTTWILCKKEQTGQVKKGFLSSNTTKES